MATVKTKTKPRQDVKQAKLAGHSLAERAAALITPVNLGIGVIVLLGVALRAYHISEPFGGYHAFNEGFYLETAEKSLNKGIFSILFSPADYNNPPLYSLLLLISFKLFGLSEASARIVSVLASGLTIAYLFKLGKLAYNEKIGFMAAVIFAFMPGAVLVGRNVQLEPVLILLIVASIHYYIRGTREKNLVLAGAGGALLGLGLITKLPAVLIVPGLAAWEIWRTRGFGWIKQRSALVFFGAFALVGLPWYLIQVIANAGTFLGAQAHLASTLQVPDAFFLRYNFYEEILWMLSPLVFVAFLMSVAWMLYRRQGADKLVLVMAATFIAFYCFYHFHTYYIIPLAPFAAMAVARGLYSINLKSWKPILWAMLGTAAILFFFSFVLLGGQKFGKNGIVYVERQAGVDPSKLTIEAGGSAMGNYGPVLTYYTKQARLINYPPAANEAPRKGDFVVILDSADASYPGVVPFKHLMDTDYRLVLFGYAFEQIPPRRHMFMNGPITAQRVGSFFDFGVDVRRSPSSFALYLPKE